MSERITQAVEDIDEVADLVIGIFYKHVTTNIAKDLDLTQHPSQQQALELLRTPASNLKRVNLSTAKAKFLGGGDSSVQGSANLQIGGVAILGVLAAAALAVAMQVRRRAPVMNPQPLLG